MISHSFGDKPCDKRDLYIFFLILTIVIVFFIPFYSYYCNIFLLSTPYFYRTPKVSGHDDSQSQRVNPSVILFSVIYIYP